MVEWPEAGQAVTTLIEGPAGKLECRVERPPGESRGLMLICHPHPQFGGTMDNKVVHSLARSAVSTGWTAVRFNFRGIGQSEGAFDDAVGELQDAAAALDWARSYQQGPQALVLAGFSFGAAIALRLSTQTDCQRLICIAPPLRYFDNETLPEPGCPWLVVHGDRDDVVDCQETVGRLEKMRSSPKVEILAGAGHFFHGRLTELRKIVESFLD